jgi:hypothetical protein
MKNRKAFTVTIRWRGEFCEETATTADVTKLLRRALSQNVKRVVRFGTDKFRVRGYPKVTVRKSNKMKVSKALKGKGEYE